MMRRITLLAVPNQTFSFDSGNARFDMRIFSAGDRMCLDLDIDEVRVLSGCRIVCGEPMIPYDYLSTRGNFALVTDSAESPNWRQFGVTQYLVYGDAES